MLRPTMFLVALATLLPAQKTAPWWKGSWEAAHSEARERNVPLLIAFNNDGEEANERAVTFYELPEFVKVADRVIAVIASPAAHEEKKVPVTTGEALVCSRFGRLRCTNHRDLERAARPAIYGKDPVKIPSHFVILPDGTEVWRHESDVPSIGALEHAIGGAQKKLGRGLTGTQYELVRDGLREARAALRNEDPALALKAVDRIEAGTKGTPFEKEIASLHAEAKARADRELARADELQKSGRAVDAMRLLRDAAVRFRGTKLQQAFARAESALRRTRSGREAAKALAREERVRPTLAKAEACERSGDFQKAALHYLDVVERAEGTPLADKALARLEELSRDPDIGPTIEKARKEREADAALSKAVRLLKEDREKGRESLKRLIEEFPGSPAAEKAAKLLEEGD